MTYSSDRLDQIETILAAVAQRQQETAAAIAALEERQAETAQQQAANIEAISALESNDRLKLLNSKRPTPKRSRPWNAVNKKLPNRLLR